MLIISIDIYYIRLKQNFNTSEYMKTHSIICWSNDIIKLNLVSGKIFPEDESKKGR